MSKTRRNFSAKFKASLVLEVLKGEKDINTIATENDIQPNLLRNWKKEFLSKADVVFDESREDNLKETSVKIEPITEMPAVAPYSVVAVLLDILNIILHRFERILDYILVCIGKINLPRAYRCRIRPSR